MTSYPARTAGFLFSAMVAFSSPFILTGCDQDATLQEQVTVEAEQHVLSGKVMYRERMAMPPGATVTVTLADVSRMDAPAQVLAQQHIENPGSVPVPFALRYQTAAVTMDHPLAYAVRAEIRGEDGTLLWTTTQRHTVELGGELAPTDVTILLEKVGQDSQPDGE